MTDFPTPSLPGAPRSISGAADTRSAHLGHPLIPDGWLVLGVGCDLVHVPSFVNQCTAVGTTFTHVFSAAEVRYAHRNCNLATESTSGRAAPGGANVAADASPMPVGASSAAPMPFAPESASVWGPHLAARWAAREAFIKAWSSALSGGPPVVEDSPELLAGISVTADQWGRPHLHLAPWVARAFADSCPTVTPLLSLSHDGDYAMAIVILSPTT